MSSAPSARAPTFPVLPSDLVEAFERPASDARDRSLPLSQVLDELQRLNACLAMPGATLKPNNVRYVAEPFTADTPMPLRPERGDFELHYTLPGLFGSTFEAILSKNRNAHRIYVHLSGMNLSVRVHRLPYWAQANNIIVSVANEAEKRAGVRFLPFQALVEATNEDEELAALQQLEPPFAFTPAEVAATETGATLLDQFLAYIPKRTPKVLFWSIQGTSDNNSAQIRIWVMAAPEKVEDKATVVPEKAPLPTLTPKIAVKEEEKQPEVPIVVTARSLLNKKRRPNDEETMTM